MKGHNWGPEPCRKCGKNHGHVWNYKLTKDSSEKLKIAIEKMTATKRKNVEHVIITCKYCGKEFKDYPSALKYGRKFCSRTCCNEYRKEESKTNLKCKQCKKNFNVKPFEIRNGRKFCSKQCFYDWRKENHISDGKMRGKILSCDNCSKEIYVNRTDLKHLQHHFCSKKCYWVWKHTHPNRISYIEVLMSKILDSASIKYIWQNPLKYREGAGGCYKFLDFYLPNHGIVIECDGKYWHNKKEDSERDKIVLGVLGPGWRIEHIPGKEIYEWAEWLGVK